MWYGMVKKKLCPFSWQLVGSDAAVKAHLADRTTAPAEPGGRATYARSCINHTDPWFYGYITLSLYALFWAGHTVLVPYLMVISPPLDNTKHLYVNG